MLYGVLPWFLWGFLKLRLRRPIIFSEKQWNWLKILMYMIKDVLNVPKISITHFRQKSKLRSFAFARQNTYADTVLWVFKTYCCCTSSILTHNRSIQVELGKVEGFRVTLKGCCELLVNDKRPFKCKAASSLAVYAIWTSQLLPSSLKLWISSVCINNLSACAI